MVKFRDACRIFHGSEFQVVVSLRGSLLLKLETYGGIF